MNAEDLLAFRRALRVVHHVRGRIRLRVGPALFARLSAVNGNGVQGRLRSLEGIRGVRVNPAAATVIIEYEPGRLAPAPWETLLEGSDAEAAQLLARLLHRYGVGHQSELKR